MSFVRSCSLAFGLVLIGAAVTAGSVQSKTAGGWPTHGGNAQHSGVGSVAAQPMNRIVWSAPLDLQPQYNGDVLYAHYGSPVVSDKNVAVIPVKTGANGGFRIEGRNGATGALLWQQDTDYVTPDHSWFPTVGPTLIKEAVAYPRKAGLIGFHDPSVSEGPNVVCFYGMQNYLQNPAAYDAAVRISSPLVTSDGTVYFTYRVQGDTPIGLKGGIVALRRNGVSSYIEATEATHTSEYVRPKLNAAPAVNDGVVYTVFKKGDSNDGVLMGLNARTLKPMYIAPLNDPRGGPSYVDDDGTACPTIGPDGDVYFGVLENPFGSHHYRGWLLHFDRTLTQTKTPGSFGWDDSPTMVPSSLVRSYTGDSSYLVMTKYNNYVGAGDGLNKIAILDPNATQTDPYSGVKTMKEALTKVGPTPDAGNTGSFPNAVREWCINTAAVDVLGKSILVNNEDGVVYRWNLTTNTLEQPVRITNGIGQAYTPTLIGATGLVFAISNARVYAIGR